MIGSDYRLAAFIGWYQGLKTYAASGGGPARGTIGAALVVLDRLKQNYALDLSAHQAAGGAQIRGVSKSAVESILKRFGEDRPFSSEAGRTNRGGPGDIGKMLDTLRELRLDGLPPDERGDALEAMQSFLVDRIRDIHNRARLKVIYNPANSTRQSISDLLAAARETGREGQVAQHLVGAKLALRFPKLTIANESYSTADAPTGRPGDFLVSDTAFHITNAPQPRLYEKCLDNLKSGLRVFLLVPDRIVVGARQNAETAITGRITVESIESFVSQNIEELALFESDELKHGFRRLLETYNARVDAAEADKSLMVDVPLNLLPVSTRDTSQMSVGST